MPDVTFQINDPTLLPGQKFKTRYRLLPVGAFTANVDRTNAAFTITGLAAGQYELEAILVLADATECAPTYWKFTVLDPVECIDFTVEIVERDNGLFALEIDYSLPSPIYNPPCGWQIIHNGGTVTYPTLPTPPIYIPTTNVSQQVRIISNGCGSNVKECFNEDVPPAEVTCTPMDITAVSVEVAGSRYPNGFYPMAVTFTYNQSNPITINPTVIITQINVLSGTPGQASYPNFTYPAIPSAGGTFTTSLVANDNVFNSLYQFTWLVVDKCNKTHTGTVQILL